MPRPLAKRARAEPTQNSQGSSIKPRQTVSAFGAGFKLLSLFLLAACGTSTPIERPATPAVVVQTRKQPVAVVAKPAPNLYAPDEALRDVLSGELEYVGTGHWPGIERLWACAFRNARVVVINVYCTVSDLHVFRLDVLSPERGHVRIYAEAKGPISARDRALYFTFTASSEPPLGPRTSNSPLSLTMSYDELRGYDQRRYEAFLPGCFGGEQHHRPIGGCLGSLADHQAQWLLRNRTFLQEANGDWYRVMRALRQLAKRHGRDPAGD
jgi:hypothetical protein